MWSADLMVHTRNGLIMWIFAADNNTDHMNSTCVFTLVIRFKIASVPIEWLCVIMRLCSQKSYQVEGLHGDWTWGGALLCAHSGQWSEPGPEIIHTIDFQCDRHTMEARAHVVDKTFIDFSFFSYQSSRPPTFVPWSPMTNVTVALFVLKVLLRVGVLC